MRFTVRQARVHAGITQAEVAKMLGIDRSTYLKIEKEPQRATICQINKISEITGISVGDIFLGCNSTNVGNIGQDSRPTYVASAKKGAAVC